MIYRFNQDAKILPLFVNNKLQGVFSFKKCR